MDVETQRMSALRQCKRLDSVDQAGVAAANSLMAGRTVEVAFAPGNGTRYVFLLAPVSYLDTFVAGADPQSGAAGPGAVLVGELVNGKAIYPISLLDSTSDVPHPSYLAEKWFDGSDSADVFILERLFETIVARAKNLAELRKLSEVPQ